MTHSAPPTEGVTTPPAPSAATEHALYRFFATDGALLYVGISIHPFARMGQHQGDKSWWGEVSSTTIERFPDRPSVLAAEREAIKDGRPRYNIVHAGRARTAPRPKTMFAYTYWEPAVGGLVSVANVLPMMPAAFLLRCECGATYMAGEITDHGGDDFLAQGPCECGRSTFRYVPRIHRDGVEHLSERSPYLFIRRRP